MLGYYDRQGRPLDLGSWSQLLTDEDYKIVARSVVNGYAVSTVWLGLDHQFGQGSPLIFETMVFATEALEDAGICERYSTEDEARAGHDEIVTLLRGTT